MTLEGPRAAYDNVFFANSGSGGVEAAIKLARAATKKPRVLSLDGAYHGCTMGSCALMKPGMFKDPFGPHVPGLEPIPFGDIDALAAALRDGDVAAVIARADPARGRRAHAVVARSSRSRASSPQKHGALLVADEIQTGLGRTGRFLASECWPRRPDVIVLGKHLGGGLVPISAMLTTPGAVRARVRRALRVGRGAQHDVRRQRARRASPRSPRSTC